jgi:Na+-transporting NADH:ubiquinone oxidoreductase subunit NqrB
MTDLNEGVHTRKDAMNPATSGRRRMAFFDPARIQKEQVL